MTVLVIGGNGMLGTAILRRLRSLGTAARSFDVSPHPDPEVDSRVGDIRQPESLIAACEGVEAVIHNAAVVSQQVAPSPEMYDINVQGTKNVIAACQAQKVARLIYTSSIDVVFDGTPIANGDEDLPYPAKHLDYYSTTKMLAEQAVIGANGEGGLTTCSLRVAGIYGPGDRHRFPRVVQPVLESGLYTRLGDGSARFNHLYATNAAHAHILAADRLFPGSAAAGQCCFITDHAPGNFFDFFPPYLDALGLRYRVRTVPYALARSALTLLETSARLRLLGASQGTALSRYSIEATSRDFWFNAKKAARVLGYAPIVSAEAAFDETLIWLRGWVEAYRAGSA
ncbi:MAG: NAD-dependent epimerase/dehydratase family protein [Anaerolineae bacterium]|nr:NAD-dependent epimerase/dehydratase family protein [Anaerolineae bacterium]NUQ04132.1 NAD-dependent epimerase/dehydratase family protein [Anaerolineae bacterium]